MMVSVTVDLDVDQVAVAYEYGLDIDDVTDFVRESVAMDMLTHYGNLGWLKEGRV